MSINNVSSVYDGTVVYSGTAPTYVTGPGGDEAISLTGGSGQYVSLPSGPPGPFDVPPGTAFTFECYFQLAALPSSGTAILAQRNQTWAVGVTSAGDVSLTISGVSVAIAAGVTLSLAVWYHVAVVYIGNRWYLLVNGAAPASPPAAGYDGGAVGPAGQSIGGDGTAAGTFPGLIAAARVSTAARYPAAAYVPPTVPLATDLDTRAIWSMNGTVQNTGVLLVTGPGGGTQGSGQSYGFTVGVMPGASLSGNVTVDLLVNGTTTGLSPTSVTLTTSQTSATFTFTPQAGQGGTDLPIAATSTGLSPSAVAFYVYTAQAYTIAVAAPYGSVFSGLAAQLGFQIIDPANPTGVLRWAPGTAGVIEAGSGTGVYVTLLTREPDWSRVLVWDAPPGGISYVMVLNPERAAGS